jgi:hypothetical protein
MMLHRSLLLLAALAIASCVTGCPASPGTSSGEGESGEGEGEGNTSGTDIVLDHTDVVETPDIAADQGIAMALRNDGRVALLFVNDRTDGQTTNCINPFGTSTPTVLNQDVVVADEQTDGTYRTRIVDSPPQLFADSLSIAVDPVSDALVVAYMGGAVAQGVCQGSDLMVAVENGDTFGAPQTMAANSSDGSGPCRTPQNICSQGDTVGRFPCLAHDKTGAHWELAYNDIHFGFADKDLHGSDLEVGLAGTDTGFPGNIDTVLGDAGAAWFQGCAMTQDTGLGLVTMNIIASDDLFKTPGDPNSGTVTFHEGVWMATEQADTTWVLQPVFPNGTLTDRAGAAATADGLWGVFHEAGTGKLIVVRSVDNGATWTPTVIEQTAKTGTYPGIGELSDGTLIVGYGHCANTTQETGCPAAEDGVRIAWKNNISDVKINKKTFTGGDEDADGKHTFMSIDASDNIVISSFSVTTAGDKKIRVQHFKKVKT